VAVVALRAAEAPMLRDEFEGRGHGLAPEKKKIEVDKTSAG